MRDALNAQNSDSYGGMFGLVGATLVLSYRHTGFVGQASRLRTRLWLVLLIGLAISFLPEISMAGHLGGLIGGPLLASVCQGTAKCLTKRCTQRLTPHNDSNRNQATSSGLESF